MLKTSCCKNLWRFKQSRDRCDGCSFDDAGKLLVIIPLNGSDIRREIWLVMSQKLKHHTGSSHSCEPNCELLFNVALPGPAQAGGDIWCLMITITGRWRPPWQPTQIWHCYIIIWNNGLIKLHHKHDTHFNFSHCTLNQTRGIYFITIFSYFKAKTVRYDTAVSAAVLQAAVTFVVLTQTLQ